jgi:hypothetical protein
MKHSQSSGDGIPYMSVGNPWLRHSSHPQEKEGGPKKNEKQKKKKKTPPFTPLPNKGHGFVTQGHETVVARHEVMYDGQSFVPWGHETTVKGHGTTVKEHDHMVQGHEVMHVCGSFMGVHEERGARISTEDHVATHGWTKQALGVQKYKGMPSEDG